MKTDIPNTAKPAEIQLLVFPFRSTGENLIRIYLHDLCLRQVLVAENKRVKLTWRSNFKRERLHLRMGPNFENRDKQSKAENFLLEPFTRKTEIRFYELRNHIVNALSKDLDKFKSKYVYKDARDNGLIMFRYFRTSKGSRLSKKIRSDVDYVATHIDNLIENDLDKLVGKLDELGFNICLLQEDILEKIRELDYDIVDLSQLKFLSSVLAAKSSFGYIGLLSADSFSGSSAFDIGGSDFGGGDFGGGGAGGDW